VLAFLPFWLEAGGMFLAQCLVFIGVALLFSIPAIAIRLIPRPVRYWRASNMARRQFLENNLHHTRGETGVLIFVSEAERYVEIIADRGINQHVDPQTWQAIVDRFTGAVKRGDTANGFVDCIKSCGEILQKNAPATQAKNELPNHLIVLD
jgi:putative membrane protein